MENDIRKVIKFPLREGYDDKEDYPYVYDHDGKTVAIVTMVGYTTDALLIAAEIAGSLNEKYPVQPETNPCVHGRTGNCYDCAQRIAESADENNLK